MKPITLCLITIMVVAIGLSLGVCQASAAEDPRDLVIHAAGSVEFRVPLGWRLSEVAVGREVRLLLSPHKLTREAKGLTDGVWIAHHRRSTTDAASKDLRQTLAARLRFTRSADKLAGPIDTGPLEEIPLAGQKALRLTFRTTINQAGKATEARGFHILARTRAGLFEVQLITPADQFDRRSTEIDQLLRTLILSDPAPLRDKPLEAFAGAASILGAWKSPRGRLFIRGNGELVMQFDRQGVYPIAGDGSLRYDKKVSRLTGQYESRRDLLLVTWADGSRTNYRWRLDRGELLLTDHTGRVSQLRALFE